MPAQTAFFQGDAPELVDALIEACQRKPVANPALEGLVGRDLVPFEHFDDTLPTAPTVQGTKHAASSSPGSSPTARSPARNKRSKARQSMDAPAASPAARAAARRSPAPSASGSVISAGSALGCPAFFTSPKPAALPLPSTGLLQKALLASATAATVAVSCNAAAAAAAAASDLFFARERSVHTAAA